jgi:multidrug resistance efflux pump
MKPPKFLIPVAVLAMLVGLGLYIDYRRAANDSRMTGYFENQPTDVASRLPGRVAEIFVNEGDTVKKGQPLVRLEAAPSTRDEQARLAQAEQAAAAFQEALHGPRPEDVAKQEGVVAEAKADYEKLVNGPLPEEIAAARERYVEAEANYQKVLSGSRPQEIAAATAAANQARQGLRIAQRGDTPEERTQAQARVADARAAEDYASKELARSEYLFKEGAIPRNQLDLAQSNFLSAQAHTQEMVAAEHRSREGTPAEELAQANAAYRQLKAQEDLALAGSRSEDVAVARASMGEALQNYKLLLRGSRKEDIEAGRARLDQAEAQLEELRAGTRREEIDQARATALAAYRQAESAKANIAESTIYAPIDGIVERVLIAKGDLLDVGAATVRMSDPADIWLRVYLPEEQLAKVKVGDPVALKVDGIDQTVSAKVETISTTGEFTPENLQTPEERAKQVFSVRVRLSPPDSRIKAGMAASVKRMGNWP